jgi:hypothetical protein
VSAGGSLEVVDEEKSSDEEQATKSKLDDEGHLPTPHSRLLGAALRLIETLRSSRRARSSPAELFPSDLTSEIVFSCRGGF